MMAGLPNIQTAQYGDRVALEKLGASRKTNNPAVDVQSMNNMQGGRPKNADVMDPKFDPMKFAQEQIRNGGQGGAPQGMQLSPTEQQHQGMLNSLAEMYKDTMKMIRVAARPEAGPLTKAHALSMIKAYQQEFMRVRDSTPFFDGA
jgi:hypothetical protein